MRTPWIPNLGDGQHLEAVPYGRQVVRIDAVVWVDGLQGHRNDVCAIAGLGHDAQGRWTASPQDPSALEKPLADDDKAETLDSRRFSGLLR
jgi:hypothetical protein